MAVKTKKIIELPEKTTMIGGDLFIVEDVVASVTKKVTFDVLTTNLGRFGDSLANAVVNSTIIEISNTISIATLNPISLDIGSGSAVINTTGFTSVGYANIATTLSAGNTTITGFANVTNNLQVGTRFVVNTTATFQGNSTANAIIGYNTTNLTLAEFAGSANSYNYVLIRNANTQSSASADLAIYNDSWSSTADKWLDIGITSSTYSNTTWTIGNANDAYIYTGNSNLTIGANGTGSYINFFTVNSLIANERMRIAANGNVGIGNTTPADKLSVSGSAYIGGAVTGITTIAHGNTTVTGFINVSSTANIAGNANVGGVLNVNGAVTITNTISHGNTTLTGFINVSSSANVGGTLNVNGAVTITNTIAHGNTTITGFANISGNVTASYILANTKLNVGTAAGFDFTTTASIEIDASQNTFVQAVIQNANTGTNASSDLVVTNDTGNNETGYVDLGINSSLYSNTLYTIGGASDAYLYASNGALSIGTASAKSVIFHANGTLSTNEAMRIDAGANVGIGNTAPNAKLQVTGTANVSGNVAIAGTLTSNVAAGSTSATAAGYMGVPQNFTNTSFQLALTDMGKHILTQNTGSSTQVIQIANNATVAFPIGAAITIVVQSTGTIVLQPNVNVSMYYAGNSTSASRTVNAYGIASLLKVGTDTWMLTGVGVT